MHKYIKYTVGTVKKKKKLKRLLENVFLIQNAMFNSMCYLPFLCNYLWNLLVISEWKWRGGKSSKNEKKINHKKIFERLLKYVLQENTNFSNSTSKCFIQNYLLFIFCEFSQKFKIKKIQKFENRSKVHIPKKTSNFSRDYWIKQSKILHQSFYFKMWCLNQCNYP